MFQHKLPIHLETEDKFILNFTARQCVMLAVGLGMAWIVFTDISDWLPTTGGLVLGLVAGLLLFAAIVALALVQVKKRGLEEWAIVWLLYRIQPKHFYWAFNHDELIEDENEQKTPIVESKEW